MTDMILCTVPYSNLLIPPSAPAVLKGVAESYGYSIYTHDLCIDLRNLCGDDYFDVQLYYTTSAEKSPLIDEFTRQSAELLVNHDSEYIGISVFSIMTHLCVYELCKAIREISDKKIVLGGRGCSATISGELHFRHSIDADQDKFFGDIMEEMGLADIVVMGDGEEAIVDIFRGTVKDFYQSPQQLSYPYPNFDDYKLAYYSGPNNSPQLPVYTSKGCVRKCDFCDVIVQMKKFSWKPGDNIVDEMIYLAERYDIRDFSFVDSITNGNIRELSKTLDKLAEYNEKHPDKKLTWNGNWICRPIGQLNDEFYSKLKPGGCKTLLVGIEHGSNNVLTHMNKKTSVEAFWYEMEQFEKYGIECGVNLIVGHWSETWENFLELCQFVIDFHPYVRSGLLTSLNVGSTLHVLHDTSVYNADHIHTSGNYNWAHVWKSDKNPDLDLKERLCRFLIIADILDRYGYPTNFQEPMKQLLLSIENNEESINEFYKR